MRWTPANSLRATGIRRGHRRAARLASARPSAALMHVRAADEAICAKAGVSRSVIRSFTAAERLQCVSSMHREQLSYAEAMIADDLMYAKVAGHSVAYRMIGTGPPLVLLHGFLCDSRCWRTQLVSLADQFTLIAWDAPGAGFSTDPPDASTTTDWAHTLAGFLDAAGVQRAHFLGLSWGGMLTQELYRLDPARVIIWSGRRRC